MARRKKSKLKLKIKPETVHSIVAVILIMIGLLVVVSFTGQGMVLAKINEILQLKLGVAMLFLPFVFISSGMVMFKTKWMWSKPHVLLGTLLLFLGTLGLASSGEIGENVFRNVASLLAPAGALVLFLTIFVIGILIVTQSSVIEFVDALSKIKLKFFSRQAAEPDLGVAGQLSEPKSSRFSLPKLSFGKKSDEPFSINQGQQILADSADDEIGTAIEPATASKTTAQADDKSDELGESLLSPNTSKMIWEYPPLSLLSSSDGGEADRGDVKHNAQMIEKTFDSFGIRASIKEVNYGPSVTQYALELASGTKLSKVTSLTTDMALALAAPGGQVRIEAPIPGRSLVGIEVPNYSPQYVTLKKMLSSAQMKKNPSKLAVALGIDVAGNPVVMDIAKMPHMLIAGATGSGKSVAVNTFISSILFRASPDEVKFILVDPKRVELTGYNDIPHLFTPVIVEPKKVVSALRWAVEEMNRRYKQLAEVGVRNIDAFNELSAYAAMPSIVIIIDELADIMLFSPSEVEESITRIAQMARAVGIHLVLATQRPSVDVITGLIKANIPGRIAFNVSSMTDSRVILDGPGAEKLLGKGDMLFLPPDKSKPIRVQGTFVSDQEIVNLVDFIKQQGQAPQYEDEITTKYNSVASGGVGTGVGDDQDELFDEVVKYVAKAGKGSSSSIQRRFSVGYNRAARILDQLQEAGMVGPPEGSKPREVNTAAIMDYLRKKEAESS